MKFKKVICVFFIIAIIISSNVFISFATTSSDLKNQQSDIDKQIEKTKNEIADVEHQMSKELDKILELNSEIDAHQTEINNLEGQISSMNSQIDQKTMQITELEDKFAKQKEGLDKNLVAIYETGETTYLDMLLSSEGLADFISKYYLISELAEYEEELLNKIQNTKEQITEEKNAIEAIKVNIEASKKNVEQEKRTLASSVNVKKNLVDNLSAEEAELQKKLEEYEADKKQIQSELARIAAEEAKKNGGNSVVNLPPSAAGYIFPVSGCSKSNINNLSYPSYNRHTGVDINKGGVSGKEVVAVKDGTVVKSLAMKNPAGQYKSYGEYVVINHHDGTMTLYAHMIEGSRKVSQGDTVSQGQVLGNVGSTGNSTGPHLHFEVLIGGKPVNPIPYLP